MDITRFHDRRAFTDAAAELLSQYLRAESAAPAVVMLSGGQTPLPVYATIARSGVKAADPVHVVFSDERMVPPHSADSNYGNAAPMIRAIELPEARVLRVRTDDSLTQAADEYNHEIGALFDQGGRIVLGLLGLGADGQMDDQLFGIVESVVDQIPIRFYAAVDFLHKPGPER